MLLSTTKLLDGLYSPVLYRNPSFPEFSQSLGKLPSLAKDMSCHLRKNISSLSCS